jgi:hypothetical protein
MTTACTGTASNVRSTLARGRTWSLAMQPETVASKSGAQALAPVGCRTEVGLPPAMGRSAAARLRALAEGSPARVLLAWLAAQVAIIGLVSWLQPYQVGVAEGLSMVMPVSLYGIFDERVTDFAGQSVKDADKTIVAKLEAGLGYHRRSVRWHTAFSVARRSARAPNDVRAATRCPCGPRRTLMSTSPIHHLARAALVVASIAACEAQADPTYSGEPIAILRGAVTGTAGSEPVAVGALWFRSTPDLECSGPVSSCHTSAVVSGPPNIGCSGDCDDALLLCDNESLITFEACMASCGLELVELLATPTWGLCANAAVSETVPVTGTFPAKFMLKLFEPPPEAAILQSMPGQPRAALAWLVAQPAEAAPVDVLFESEEPWNLLGVAERHVLFYAADPIPADSDWGQLVGGALDAGYHVLDVVSPETVCVPLNDNGDEMCHTGQFTLQPSADGIDTEIELELGPLGELQPPLFAT